MSETLEDLEWPNMIYSKAAKEYKKKVNEELMSKNNHNVSFEAKPTKALQEFEKFWTKFVKGVLSDSDSCLSQLDSEYIARCAFKAGLELGVCGAYDSKLLGELING